MKTMTLAALLFLVSCFLAGGHSLCGFPAWSTACPIHEIRILGNVVVNQKEVSLLEICDPETLPGEWKTIMGGLDIGEAPPGGRKSSSIPDSFRTYLDGLLDSKGIHSSDVKFDIPEKIVVRRQSTKVSQEWIEQIFKEFIFGNSPWQREDINIERVRFSGVPARSDRQTDL